MNLSLFIIGSANLHPAADASCLLPSCLGSRMGILVSYSGKWCGGLSCRSGRPKQALWLLFLVHRSLGMPWAVGTAMLHAIWEIDVDYLALARHMASYPQNSDVVALAELAHPG